MKIVLKLALLVVVYYMVVGLFGFLDRYITNKSKLKITFADVGQGDAVLVTVADKNILVDTGGYGSSDVFINNLFHSPRCYFEAVFVTHPHADHAGDLERILQRCKIGILRINDVAGDVWATSDFTTRVQKNSQTNNFRDQVVAGEKYIFGETKFYIFWPSKIFLENFNKLKTSTRDLNKVSTVILVKYADKEILLTGDAESSVLLQIDLAALRRLIDGPLDVLKVPHHGSRLAVNGDILELLRPIHCVISVGANNYGHPNAGTLDLLSKHCKVYRTDTDGNIEFAFK